MRNGIFAYRHHIREMIQEDDLMKILDKIYAEEEELFAAEKEVD